MNNLSVIKTYDEMLKNAVWRPLTFNNFRNSWQIIDNGKILFESALLLNGDTHYKKEEILSFFDETKQTCEDMINFIITHTIQGTIKLLHNSYYNNIILTLFEYTIEPSLESRFNDIIIYLKNNEEVKNKYNLIEDF